MMKTKQLFIRRLSEKDTRFIFKLLNTEGWIRYIGNRNIHSEADALTYIQKINENPNIIYWTVVLKETNSEIGLVTLIKRDYLYFRDIGFAFLPEYSDKGYAYEASKAVLESLTETILAITLPENKSSIRLIEKLGLKFEKAFKVEHENLLLYSNSNIITENYSNITELNTTAEKVFNALTNEIPLWWTKYFEGTANQQNDTFTVRFGKSIYKTIQVTELSQHSKVVWIVTNSEIGIPELKNQTEWIGTAILWEIIPKESNIQLKLTHIGLLPTSECYDLCKNGWQQFTNSLKLFLETGKGNPFKK